MEQLSVLIGEALIILGGGGAYYHHIRSRRNGNGPSTHDDISHLERSVKRVENKLDNHIIENRNQHSKMFTRIDEHGEKLARLDERTKSL